MTRPPFAAVFAACAAALGAAQVFVPTAHAAPKVGRAAPRKSAAPTAPDYQIRVLSQTVTQSFGGLIVRGRIRNTGRRALTYTSVVADLPGAGVAAHGYLTVSPLLPGQAAEYRVCEPRAATPPEAGAVRVSFREAGRAVTAEAAAKPPTRLAQAESQSSTVR